MLSISARAQTFSNEKQFSQERDTLIRPLLYQVYIKSSIYRVSRVSIFENVSHRETWTLEIGRVSPLKFQRAKFSISSAGNTYVYVDTLSRSLVNHSLERIHIESCVVSERTRYAFVHFLSRYLSGTRFLTAPPINCGRRVKWLL